jgi:hypothetical protein
LIQPAEPHPVRFLSALNSDSDRRDCKLAMRAAARAVAVQVAFEGKAL